MNYASRLTVCTTNVTELRQSQHHRVKAGMASIRQKMQEANLLEKQVRTRQNLIEPNDEKVLQSKRKPL